MIFPRFHREQRGPDTISVLYGMIVAQARLPRFYRDYAVADTVNGRFDMVVLHLTVLLGRMLPDPALKGLGQGVFDRFCQDMDHNLREMGIGDLKVPKEMQRLGEAFYGRQTAYQTALTADDTAALEQAIARNVYGGSAPNTTAVAQLAAYMKQADRDLAAQSAQSLAAGQCKFPEPALIPAAA